MNFCPADSLNSHNYGELTLMIGGVLTEPLIVFQSSRFAIIDKPSEWLSVPSRLGAAEQRNCAGIWLQDYLGKRVYPVHRLDFGASGLLVFALDAEAHRVGNGFFEHSTVSKEYQAITSRLPGHSSLPIGEDLHWESLVSKGKKRAYEDLTRGKACKTDAKLVSDDNGTQTWRLHPLTGRSHQLRWELSHRGYPILGDELYGSGEKWREGGIALRLVKLVFPPVPLTIDRELPKVAIVNLLSEQRGSNVGF